MRCETSKRNLTHLGRESIIAFLPLKPGALLRYFLKLGLKIINNYLEVTCRQLNTIRIVTEF